MKPLKHYLESISYQWNQQGSLDLLIHSICSDSRKVSLNDLFVAIPGPRVNGEQFIREAVSRGAKAIISQQPDAWLNEQKIPHFVVSEPRRVFSELIARYYQYPARKLKLIGITGTNGKTTCAFLLRHLLNGGSKAGLIGTVYHDDGKRLVAAENTTPGPEELQMLFAQMAANGLDYCIMEVSSHALDQERTWGLSFSSALFTNLTQDHLDYHKDFEHYYQAKRKLFFDEPTPQHLLVNIDDAYGVRLFKELNAKKTKSFGFSKEADYQIQHFSQSLNGISFDFVFGKNRFPVKAPLLLRHNAMNMLGVLSVLVEEGWDMDDIVPRFLSFVGVPGRMERVMEAGDVSVFVDYAHTPDAIEKILSEIKSLVSGRMITVFGCGGDRDTSKRPLMGKIADQYSDRVILTSDNPRSENPLEVIRQIQAGITSVSKSKIDVAVNRKDAIAQALEEAKPGDAVFVFGKGHEDYQIIGKEKIPFRDQDTIKEWIQKNRSPWAKPPMLAADR